MAGPCEQGNETLVFIKYAEFIDELSSSKFCTGQLCCRKAIVCYSLDSSTGVLTARKTVEYEFSFRHDGKFLLFSKLPNKLFDAKKEAGS